MHHCYWLVSINQSESSRMSLVQLKIKRTGLHRIHSFYRCIHPLSPLQECLRILDHQLNVWVISTITSIHDFHKTCNRRCSKLKLRFANSELIFQTQLPCLSTRLFRFLLLLLILPLLFLFLLRDFLM